MRCVHVGAATSTLKYNALHRRVHIIPVIPIIPIMQHGQNPPMEG